MNNQNTEIESKAINICKSLNLIRFKANSIFELDEKGVFAIEDGGIEKYLENIRTEKNLEQIIRKLTSKRLKNEIWHNLMYVTVGGIIGGLIGLLTLLVSPNNTEKLIQELHKTVEQKGDNNDNFQTDIQQMRSEIISLKTEVDSLRNSELLDEKKKDVN